MADPHFPSKVICYACGGAGEVTINGKRIECQNCLGDGWEQTPQRMNSAQNARTALQEADQ